MKLKVKLKVIILNILLLKNLTSESFASKSDIPVITDFVKKTDFDNKLIFNKVLIKELIKELLQIKQEIQKLKLN